MPVVRHPHRPPGLAGEERGVDREDRGVLLLAAERAAGLLLDDDDPVAVEARAPASAPCARSTGTAASRGSRCPRPRAGWRSSPAARGRAAPGTRSGRCPRSPGRRRRSRRRGPPCRSGTPCRSPWPRAGRAPRAAARSGGGWRRGRPGPARARAPRPAPTGSATCRISSATSAGWSSTISATTFSPGMSAAVTTTTLDQSNAGSRSIPSSLACGSRGAHGQAVPRPRDDEVVREARGARELLAALSPERGASRRAGAGSRRR